MYFIDDNILVLFQCLLVHAQLSVVLPPTSTHPHNLANKDFALVQKIAPAVALMGVYIIHPVLTPDCLVSATLLLLMVGLNNSGGLSVLQLHSPPVFPVNFPSHWQQLELWCWGAWSLQHCSAESVSSPYLQVSSLSINLPINQNTHSMLHSLLILQLLVLTYI